MAAVPSSAVTSPASSPSPGAEHAARRPHLRVVGPPRHTTRFVVALGLLSTMAIFGIVTLHALAAEAAFEARELEGDVSELAMRREELLADVARLESPERIERVATSELGMIPAEQPGYLVLDGASDAPVPVSTRLADAVRTPAEP